jgi:hypothetical protein
MAASVEHNDDIADDEAQDAREVTGLAIGQRGNPGCRIEVARQKARMHAGIIEHP